MRFWNNTSMWLESLYRKRLYNHKDQKMELHFICSELAGLDVPHHNVPWLYVLENVFYDQRQMPT